MPKTIWELETPHGRGYIYIGGDDLYNAYLRCACSPRPRYKHFEDLTKAQAWLARHMHRHL